MRHEELGEEAGFIRVVIVERTADEKMRGGGVGVGHGGVVSADFFEGIGEAVRIARKQSP